MIWGHFASKNILLLALKIKSAANYFSWIFLFSGMSLSAERRERDGSFLQLLISPTPPPASISFLLHLLWFFWLILGWGQKKGNGTRTKCDILLLWYPNYHALFPGAKSGGLVPNSSEILRNCSENLPLLGHWPWCVLIYKEANMIFHSNHKFVFVCSINYRQ